MQTLIKDIGRIFQPLLDAFGGILAFFYSVIPNYPIDVALLTIVIMALLTPLTVKSTKNMAAMQALGPEVKKLQQKYKGDRVQLNEEMMKLYKEHNVNPASGCIPLLLQMPAFFILYSVIRGMTNTVTTPAVTKTVAGLKVVVHPATVHAEPRYIPVHSKMYQDIVAAHGQLNSFGMNFADRLLSHHSSIWAAIPYLLLVAGAVGLQYLQMARLNARNPQAAQANPQAAMLQKYMPLIFGFIYINVAAILNVYFIVSSAIRIATQEAMFRKGIVGGPPPPPVEGETAPKRPKGPVVDRTERALPRPKRAPSGNGSGTGGSGTGGGTRSPGAGRPQPGTKPAPRPTGKAGSKSPTSPSGSPGRGTAKPGANGSGPTRSGGKGGGTRSGSNGRAAGKTTPSGAAPAPKAHPRSKSKRERKAR